MKEWLKRMDFALSHYINLMALVRTILSVMTAMLSVAIFLQIFGYVG